MWLTPSQGARHNALFSLQAVCRYDLATKVPLDAEGTTYSQLGLASGLSEQMTRRIIRHAAGQYIFQEAAEGQVVHTAASKLLATDPLVRQGVAMVLEEMWPSAAKVFFVPLSEIGCWATD